MYRTTWRKGVLALAATLCLSMVAAPGLAQSNSVQSAPYDYLLEFEVVRTQALLAEKGFYRGPVDGTEREAMAHAILAFHKAADLERTTTLMPGDLSILEAWEPQVPEIPDQPDRLEVDIERQVMYLVKEGVVVATLPISSGNGELYLSYRPGVGLTRANTPRGNYEFYYHIPRWRYAALGGLYKPWYFRGGFAIHGSTSVPAYPASHGCIRVTLEDADWLAERLSIGMAINVRDTIPRDPTPTPVPMSRPFTDPLGMYS